MAVLPVELRYHLNVKLAIYISLAHMICSYERKMGGNGVGAEAGIAEYMRKRRPLYRSRRAVRCQVSGPVADSLWRTAGFAVMMPALCRRFVIAPECVAEALARSG
jgi:hypothetical protein